MNMPAKLGIILCIVASTLFPAIPLSAGDDCSDPVERQILDGLFNLEFERAAAAVETLDEQSSLIPSRGFYQALLQWARVQTGGTVDRNPEISQLRSEVRLLEDRHDQLRTPESELAWSLAAAHTARILLNEERFISAYNVGYPAVKRLGKLLDRGLVNMEATLAAQLAIGIYNIYINNLPEGLKWASFLLRKTGNTEQGRRLIEHTLANSRTLSPEAGRILLLEFPWSFPGHCDYLGLARHMVEQYPDNPDYSLARQGLLLRCGYADQASAENRRFLDRNGNGEIRGFNPTDYALQFKLGQARVMAESGDVESLRNNAGEFEGLEVYHSLAMAHAHDISGNRESARKQYQAIIDNDGTGEALRKSAEMRLIFPYVATKTVKPGRTIAFQHCQ